MAVDYKKIVVAHPGRQHSFRVAEALEKEGLLYSYVTTVYDKESSLIMRFAKLFLKGDNLRRANSRRMQLVSDKKVIQFCEWRGFFLLLLIRIDRKKRIYEAWSNYVSKTFQKKLAKYIIKEHVGIVLSYDTCSDILFDILIKKQPETVRVIDDAAVNRNYLFKIYEEHRESCLEFEDTYKQELGGFLVDEKIANRYGIESKKADYHLVASSFTAKSVKYNGFSEEKIMLVPYGAGNTVATKKHGSADRLRVLYVGDVNQRKGIGQILHVAKKLAGANVEFSIVGGGREGFENLFSPYEKYVKFYGKLLPEQVAKKYEENDVFAFPTFGDGFGFVVLEALASGLPVVCSKNCIGPDVIIDGYNGFLIDAGDEAQLENRILWFQKHPEKIAEMRENAIESVKKFSWENYEKCLVNSIHKIMKDVENGYRK